MLYFLIGFYILVGIIILILIINNFVKPYIMRKRGHFCHNCEYCHGYGRFLWFCYSPNLKKDEYTGLIKYEPVSEVFGHIYKCKWKESRDKCQKP